MGRPRKITDERMLAAAAAVIRQVGPGFTLANVAAEARISVGTLAHRFGSKHGLLLAMTRDAIESAQQTMRRVGAEVSDPVAAVRAALVEQYEALGDPTAAANNLAQLGTDLADEHLRAAMAEFYAATEAGITTLLQRAVDAGALPGAPTTAVAARILAAAVDGTAIRWSARPDGSLAERLRTDLDAILAAWRQPAHKT